MLRRWFGLLLALHACRAAELSPGRPTSARLELAPVDADVWLPTIDVRARIVGQFNGTGCTLSANGRKLTVSSPRADFVAQLPLDPGPNRVTLRCTDGAGNVLSSEPVVYRNRADASALVPPPAAAEHPGWLDDGVLYGIVPPLYGAPPLKAVTRALPELAELGVTALWLSPLFATPPGDFGYAVTDYFTIREDYGSAADLRALVERAHGLGLKVLLDFVPNHTSARHRYFTEASRLGERSHYYGFYQRDSEQRSQHYFDWQELPNLDYRNPEVRAWMTAASAHWLRDFAIDGYRVDAAWGVAQRWPTFYDAWSAQLEAVRPAVLIAEASARDPFFLQHGFDAAYDWTLELGHWAWAEVFASERGIAERLEQAVTTTERAAARADRVLRFLNNNDTGVRFVTRHGVGLTRAATVALLTLPGIPTLYSFDEVGGEFEPYAGLHPISAPRYPELREFHRRLIALRHSLPALRSARLNFVPSHNPDVAVYVRPAEGNGAALLVAVNFSDQPARLDLQLPSELSLSPIELGDLLGGVRIERATPSSLIMTLPAYGYALLGPRAPASTPPDPGSRAKNPRAR